ncbi:MAG: hypothetical protein LUI87_13845 [Lachnospiraceae bacterium]|nr:hypothetical protein [Lachnospiraceae bacterium]
MSEESEKLYNLGFEHGLEEGIALSKMGISIECAKAVTRMLQDDLPVEKIALYQNISIDDVRKIEDIMLY